MSKKQKKNDPKVGDVIYVRPNRMGRGGKAHVRMVYPSMSAGKMVTFVEVDELKCISFRWEDGLDKEQEDLREKYGDTWSVEDPD